ncbi:glutamate-5-semialdehyde dehydrogenase [Mucilaginibacter gotjawali]|uniref:Glutamate-5-semialdehyde dehydrogenase n=2 Tax=Mucilaginibacter gotjawali TaxID=1550579 RepID=A0A839SGS1_9SPHI|nr:glutamate-5-semialdehyde dehydrogenase [Mucilaginibacter gotjawali]MBB3055779.1 glutamate-5-semialdehyde dehydrogenase [Mucilaginibacter gotjawali]BAU54600.1 Gamma-glutamyl phosphate reductase [Mucilaginibacter gotjawali]
MPTKQKSYTAYFENARIASRKTIDPSKINIVLKELAKATIAQSEYLLKENKKDLDRMDPTDPKFDRLKLTAERIKDIATEIVNVAKLRSPLGHILSRKQMHNGLEIKRISVPLGIVGVIYEARPNVTFDVFALCFKTGNTCILKGGSDAEFSNQAIISIIRRVLADHDIDENIATLLPPEREATDALLSAIGYVDVLIPRGSQQLIDHVRNNSKVPVIETGAGIVHTYFDEFGDLEKGRAIILNAKTRRVSVCNALDCLIVHYTRLRDLPKLLTPLVEKKVVLYADETAFMILKGHYPDALLAHAKPEHFGTEFLSLKMAVKVVESFEDALDHIAEYGSKHSEAIISEDPARCEAFLNQVDAAAVYVNASTAFTDGAQFGLGAEIGISTQKLHARGPMGLKELTSYKWIVRGSGQTRA